MNNHFRLALGLVACVLISACTVTSDNPLSPPETAHADPRLLGDWRGGTDSDPNTCRFSITKAPWMHVDILPDPTVPKPKPNELPESYDFYPTVIGKDTFLNIVMVGKDDQGRPTKTYLFLRYKFSNNNFLHMWMISEDLPAAAIRAGKLKGLIKQNGLTLGQPNRPDIDIILQDSSVNIFRFIQNSKVDELFNNKLNGFYRVNTVHK